MDRQQTQLSQVEINRVFEELGLATQQQRDQFLPPLPLIAATSAPPDRLYVTRLSNSSQPEKAQDDVGAELG